MEYTTLGDTGVEVSRLCLGCMSIGTSDWRDWVLDEADAMELIGLSESDVEFLEEPYEPVPVSGHD